MLFHASARPLDWMERVAQSHCRGWFREVVREEDAFRMKVATDRSNNIAASQMEIQASTFSEDYDSDDRYYSDGCSCSDIWNFFTNFSTILLYPILKMSDKVSIYPVHFSTCKTVAILHVDYSIPRRRRERRRFRYISILVATSLVQMLHWHR